MLLVFIKLVLQLYDSVKLILPSTLVSGLFATCKKRKRKIILLVFVIDLNYKLLIRFDHFFSKKKKKKKNKKKLDQVNMFVA
jgi:hypothetical protein